MSSSTGRWMSGDDFFNRERELQILETQVQDCNHVLLTGQRRMRKTSVVQEIGHRLKEGLEDESYPIVMEVLAEAAIQDVFTSGARRSLERLYAELVDNAAGRTTDVLDGLVHDGYLEAGASEHDLFEILMGDRTKSEALAPLIVALRQRGGETVRAPAEVLEVAADVRKRIEEAIAEGFPIAS